MSAHYLDIQPVLRWLEDDVLPKYGSWMHVAAVLAEGSDLNPGSWHRQLMRLRRRQRIEFFALDRLCSLLGEHVSRFCDLNQFARQS
jgi:hypothetical protein